MFLSIIGMILLLFYVIFIKKIKIKRKKLFTITIIMITILIIICVSFFNNIFFEGYSRLYKHRKELKSLVSEIEEIEKEYKNKISDILIDEETKNWIIYLENNNIMYKEIKNYEKVNKISKAFHKSIRDFHYLEDEGIFGWRCNAEEAFSLVYVFNEEKFQESKIIDFNNVHARRGKWVVNWCSWHGFNNC